MLKNYQKLQILVLSSLKIPSFCMEWGIWDLFIISFLLNKSVSQSCTVGKNEIFWQATGESNLAVKNRSLLHWPQCSCVSTKTKLWKLLLQLAVCMPSLTVKWPTRIFHFQLLSMIVQLAHKISGQLRLTSRGSRTVRTSLVSSFSGSRVTPFSAINQDTSNGTENTAHRLQITVNINARAELPPACAV